MTAATYQPEPIEHQPHSREIGGKPDTMAACTGLTGYGQETHLDEVQRMSRHSLGELWGSPHYYPLHTQHLGTALLGRKQVVNPALGGKQNQSIEIKNRGTQEIAQR